MSFFRAVLTVGGLTLVSRIAGFVRDILTAALMGAGPVADAFFVALKLPNFFRRLFAEGAFSVAFVPLFAGKAETEGPEAARAFAERALALMLAVLVPFCAAAVLAMPWALVVIAPGFENDPVRYDLAVTLTRITFPYLAMVSVVALIGGVLNSLGRFAPFAAAPVLFNIVIIAALLTLAPLTPTPGHAMAWGVAASGVAQLVWMVWALRRAGMRLRIGRPRLSPDVRRLLKLMVPGAIGAGVMQINLFVDVIIASFLPTGAVSFLYYADRLNQFPLGLIGIAIGTALLPILARHVKAGNTEAVRHFQCRGLELGLVLALPAAVALAVAALPIVTVLFQRNEFGPADSLATAWALAAYAVGVPAYVLGKVLATAFFSREDTTTPVKIAAVTVAANIALALALVGWLGHVGIALATGLTSWLNVVLLGRGLRARGLLVLDERLRRAAPRVLLAAAAMGGVLWGVQPWFAPWFAGGELERAAALVVLVALGGGVFFLLAFGTGALRLADLRAMLRRDRVGRASET